MRRPMLRLIDVYFFVFLSLNLIRNSKPLGIACNDGYLLQFERDLDSVGCAGIEHFVIDNASFVAIANFWDGFSPDMSATSTVLQLSTADSSSEATIHDRLIQGIPTKGAHGVDHFDHYGDHFLVVPNYYGCERNQSPDDSDKNCQSTMVYIWDRGVSKFQFFQHIPTAGPAQTDHFRFNNDQYLAIAENFADKISIYKLMDSTSADGAAEFLFKKVQELACPGAAAVAIEALIDGSLILVGASYYVQGWFTRSPVFLMKSEQSLFQLVQFIDTHGAHDVEMIRFQETILLFVSEDRNEESSLITSGLWRWQEDAVISTSGDAAGSISNFVVQQRIPTDGAHAAEFFVKHDRLFLAVANFGDRHNKRVTANSIVYEVFLRGDHVGVVSACNVPSQGGTDWEYFVFDNFSFLALSNEGDFEQFRSQEGYKQNSNLYQFTLSERSRS